MGSEHTMLCGAYPNFSLFFPLRLMLTVAHRDELMTYLRPFAQEGRVVREEDVREFFETKSQVLRR